MSYNPEIHHRRSICLKEYDYSQEGLYFVTICTQNRKCLFGEICRRGEPVCSPEKRSPEKRSSKMVLNDAGQMIEKWYLELPNKFPDIEIDKYIIMPNHFHAIIINNGNGVGAHAVVGANLCVRPDENMRLDTTGQTHRSAPTGGYNHILGEHILGLSQKYFEAVFLFVR